MKNGRCLKCGSTDVYRHQGGTEISFRAGVAFRDTMCSSYICTACGYLEQFVDLKGEDPKMADHIKKSWQKVGK